MCTGKSSAFWELGPIPQVLRVCGRISLTCWCLDAPGFADEFGGCHVGEQGLPLCVGTVLLQDMLPGLGGHLGDSISVLQEVLAEEQPSSNFEALSCDYLSWNWAGSESICCLDYLTFVFPRKGSMGPEGFLGRTAFWGRTPLPGTQQPSLVMLWVYLPNAEINSEYFMALITPPCMWCREWVIRLLDANFLLGRGFFSHAFPALDSKILHARRQKFVAALN